MQPHDGPDTGPLLDTVVFQPKPVLIGLCSPAMGSGKSVVAHHLVAKHGFVLLRFADFLKNMVGTLLHNVGYDTTMINRMLYGDLKEWEIPEIGTTSRWLQQSIGTEWGREQIREDLWVHLNRGKAQKRLDAGQSVVFDDMRFHNEFDMIEEMGGTPVRIIRPGFQVPKAHASEGALDNLAMASLTNSRTIADLEQATDQLVASIRGNDPSRH